MSQFNDVPERDDNEIGNDSASEVGSSIKNLKDTIDNYKEGQKSQGNTGDSESKSDNKDGEKSDSNNSEGPSGSDEKGTPNDSGNSDASSKNTDNKGQNPNAPHQENNPNQNNNSPSNNQAGKNPQGNDNVGNTPQVTSGPKPGDVAGESGGASTNAGAIKPPSSSESGSQVANQGAQAAQQGAEAAKQAGEVAQAAAEGAAEGSVVPGAGTVAVAAAKVAWASRHTIAKLFMVIILVIAILSSAIETIPGVIWQMAFDENGKEVDITIEEIYTDLEQTVQNFVNEAYSDSMNKAMAKYNTGTEVVVNGKTVNLNEIYDLALGKQKTDRRGNVVRDENGNICYEYDMGSDICDIIAHFTVKCKLKNEEPTKENLRKYLDKSKDKLFTREEIPMKKIVYDIYTLVPEYDLPAKKNKKRTVLNGETYYIDSNGKPEIVYLHDDILRPYLKLVSENSYECSFPQNISQADLEALVVRSGVELNVDSGFFLTAKGEINHWEQFSDIWYGSADNVFYEYSKTKVACNTPAYVVSEKICEKDKGSFPKTVTVQNAKSVEFYLTHEKYYTKNQYGQYVLSLRGSNIYSATQAETAKYVEGLYYIERDTPTVKKKFSTYGIDCTRVVVNKFDRAALLDCFKIKNNADFPLVADFDEDNNVSVQYSPKEFTCGMAIQAYTQSLQQMLYNSTLTGTTPAKAVEKYECVVVNEDGFLAADIEISVYQKKPKKRLVGKISTNSDGVAIFEGSPNNEYEFVIGDAYDECKIYDITSKMTWGDFKESSRGFICPFQTTSEEQYIKVTSDYGWRTSPTAGASTNHGGIDMVVLLKKTDESITEGYDIRATADGEVIYSSEGSGYGYYIHIQHDNGYSTIYAHCSLLYVKKGDRVTQGQVIAKAGHTGVGTGPHLHFEVREPSGVRDDPKNYIPPNYVISENA